MRNFFAACFAISMLVSINQAPAKESCNCDHMTVVATPTISHIFFELKDVPIFLPT